MHAALAMVDILHQILDFMTPDMVWDLDDSEEEENLKKTYNDLSHVALTCRAFSCPGLNALWKRLDSLLPLLKLLPCFKMVDDVYVFTEEVLPSHWARFDYYAYRVRGIKYEHDDKMDPSVYTRLLELRRPPLLPRLRNLMYHYPKPSAFEKLFIAPTLVSVEIFVNHRIHPDLDHALEAFLESLIHRVPLLKCFEYDCTLVRPRLDSIRNFKHLSSLALTGDSWLEDSEERLGTLVTGDTYRAITGLEHLRHLTITVDVIDDLETMFATTRMEFRCLETLGLQGNFPKVVFTIGRLSASNLKELRFCSQPRSHDDYRLLLATVPFASFPSLSALIIETEDPNSFESEHDSYLDAKDIFPKPLLDLKQIDYISFDLCGLALKMGNEEVHVIASAWPNLEGLYIENSKWHWRCRPNIYCLDSFMNYCPKLKYLAIPIYTDLNMNLDDIQYLRLPAYHCLEILFVFHTMDVRDVEQTACWINYLFPFVEIRTMEASILEDWILVMEALSRRRAE